MQRIPSSTVPRTADAAHSDGSSKDEGDGSANRLGPSPSPYVRLMAFRSAPSPGRAGRRSDSEGGDGQALRLCVIGHLIAHLAERIREEEEEGTPAAPELPEQWAGRIHARLTMVLCLLICLVVGGDASPFQSSCSRRSSLSCHSLYFASASMNEEII